MGTYNLTKGDKAISGLDYSQGMFRARIPIDVEEIIAADSTLKAAAKITAADIIQLWDVPALTVLFPCFAALKIVVPGTASGTANIGIGGSTEMFNAITLDDAAGTIHCVADDATWGTDNYGGVEFESTDTIDMTFVADETTGEFVLYIPGYYCE
jgi:hypothetical protein